MDTLPTEALWCIFDYLDFSDLVTASAVCTRWKDLASHDQLWKSLCAQRSWNSTSTTWKHCFQHNLNCLASLNERLARGLDDFMKMIGHLHNNGGTETNTSDCVDFLKRYCNDNASENFLQSMEEINWMNSSFGLRTMSSTMVETCVMEKTVSVPRSDVVDLILNLNHRVLWDQAMYGGRQLQTFFNAPFVTHSSTSIPKQFKLNADDLKLLSIDAADMYWNIRNDAKIDLLHLRCFRSVYSVLEDGLIILEEGMLPRDDATFLTEPLPSTTTYQEDEILKQEPITLPYYEQADRFVVQATGFYLQKMGPSSTKIIYLVQMITDEFDMMVLELRQRLRTLALTRMANYYRTPTYKDVKNGTNRPMNHQGASE